MCRCRALPAGLHTGTGVLASSTLAPIRQQGEGRMDRRGLCRGAQAAGEATHQRRRRAGRRVRRQQAVARHWPNLPPHSMGSPG
jgi:hypothetical protein